MPTEPAIKRAIAFVDGQNLFRSAKTAFGHRYPNYDILALATAVCAAATLEGVVPIDLQMAVVQRLICSLGMRPA